MAAKFASLYTNRDGSRVAYIYDAEFRALYVAKHGRDSYFRDFTPVTDADVVGFRAEGRAVYDTTEGES